MSATTKPASKFETIAAIASCVASLGFGIFALIVVAV